MGSGRLNLVVRRALIGQKSKIVFFVVFHSISVCVLVRGVFGGMPSEDEASEA